jgi:proteasome lid subunit RPN8/RPN11
MIRMTGRALRTIREHGRRAYPEECCGALLGSNGPGGDVVASAEPIANSRADRRDRRFRIAPEDYLRLERRAAEEGRTLLGFYHSHPDHPAVPSEYDREHALPFFHYVVLGVASGEPGELASWVLSEDRGAFGREELLPAGTGD